MTQTDRDIVGPATAPIKKTGILGLLHGLGKKESPWYIRYGNIENTMLETKAII